LKKNIELSLPLLKNCSLSLTEATITICRTKLLEQFLDCRQLAFRGGSNWRVLSLWWGPL